MTIELVWEVIKAVFAFVGVCISAHYFAFAISWGWGKGRAKIPTNTNWYVKTTEDKK